MEEEKPLRKKKETEYPLKLDCYFETDLGRPKKRYVTYVQANLTKELRALEEYGLVHREVYREVPPRVEYSLTPIGIKFIPVLEALEQWAIEYNVQ